MTPTSPRKLRDEALYRYCEAEETMAPKRNGSRDDQDRALVRNRREVARLGAAVVLLRISAPPPMS